MSSQDNLPISVVIKFQICHLHNCKLIRLKASVKQYLRRALYTLLSNVYWQYTALYSYSWQFENCYHASTSSDCIVLNFSVFSFDNTLTLFVQLYNKAAFMLILRRQNQRFETLIQNALHGSTVHASLEKKTISWACTAHCSRLLFEIKWTGKAFIWRHLNVVICDFAFMLPPESAFCSNHDRKHGIRTFLGCVHAYFAKAESAFWNADSKRRSKTPFTGVLFMLPSRRRRFREHALRIVRGYCSSSSEPERRLYDVI